MRGFIEEIRRRNVIRPWPPSTRFQGQFVSTDVAGP